MRLSADTATAEAFATSWNTLPPGSVYTFRQFEEWLSPHSSQSIRGKTVLELGCGNGSLLVHLERWQPARIVGVELGSAVDAARKNMRQTGCRNFEVLHADLHDSLESGFQFVYCIGVLHHLTDPHAGFTCVIDNVESGGCFHCCVYGYEGNALVRTLVEPLRRVSSRLPWWFTKHVIAAPLSVPFYLYAKLVRRAPSATRNLPLRDYVRSISERGFFYFRHIAFDQLLAPRTVYIRRPTIEDWLKTDDRIVPESVYIESRNGNSWKFGGRVK